MQGHTGTNRLCNFFSFFPLLIWSCTKQSCYSYLATCVSCLKTETQSEGIDTHTHTHTNAHTHTHSPEGHGSRCLAEAEKYLFEYKLETIVARGFHCVLRFSTRNTASKPKNREFMSSPSLALLLSIVLGSVVKIESREATN